METANLTRSSEDLGEKLRSLGISKGYVSQLVSGARTPSLELAVRIERELGIPPSAWLPAERD
ncbi:helix-turn-helix transcriptional regulator [Caulobacter sp. SL161]|uniref:XRE family transcriptional regulator n=1 Tax=Caulobacter vibrioides TaxID=155892 RepID=A0A290MRH2_CAUVI|nr:helix-turn-helix transcriptional regulator [Caulobacter sp. SL161]ATC34633.1 XRE family transcriptional regulator [Caulobacter vibrioides]MCY1649100.1 helix-turn-helix transcriptional regulator [Caulobacter sp. SL161]